MIETAAIVIIGIGVAALAITFLVLIHEFGHFLTAKFFKVRVEEFGVGFPFPGKIWGKKIGETEYTINWLPAGGFVRLFGEDQDENDPRSFSSKPAWQRALIIVAGVVVNLVFAFVLFTIILASSGWKSEIPLIFSQNKFPFGHQENQVVVTYVEKGLPAEKAGLVPSDKIIAVDGTKITSGEELRSEIKDANGGEIVTLVENAETGAQKEVLLTPKFNEKEKIWQIGIDFTPVAVLTYPSIWEKALVGPLHSANMLQYQYVVVKDLFGQSIQKGDAAPVTENVSGIVGIFGIFVVLIQALGFGAFVPVLTIMALLSLLLGIINVLPIPAVDGGRLFFVLIELVTRKKVNTNVERWVHTVGFAVLILLFILVTFNDITKFF